MYVVHGHSDVLGDVPHKFSSAWYAGYLTLLTGQSSS